MFEENKTINTGINCNMSKQTYTVYNTKRVCTILLSMLSNQYLLWPSLFSFRFIKTHSVFGQLLPLNRSLSGWSYTAWVMLRSRLWPSQSMTESASSCLFSIEVCKKLRALFLKTTVNIKSGYLEAKYKEIGRLHSIVHLHLITVKLLYEEVYL